MTARFKKPANEGYHAPGQHSAIFRALSALFPKSKFFGGYLLNYLDENEIHEVDGISGSCMLIRRQVIDQIGYLDERFFAYQEDADYCFQAKKKGWKVVYLPTAQIIHFGGQGGSRRRSLTVQFMNGTALIICITGKTSPVIICSC